MGLTDQEAVAAFQNLLAQGADSPEGVRPLGRGKEIVLEIDLAAAHVGTRPQAKHVD
jgi:hypothetical protein